MIVLDDPFQKLYNQALKFLTYRSRAEKEVRDHLNKKSLRLEIGPEFTEKVISKLKKQNLIDDKAFAVWWCEQRAQFRPRSKKMIAAELSAKGLDRELIKEITDKTVDEELLIRRLLQKKINNSKQKIDQRGRRKLINYLLRRGFGWASAKKAIDSLSRKA
ncbi:MAG: regulatory protein RecX [Candidatus Pacebacteria bacterium]|nr:regulatory protein RecX [Candidatus Paceibacterota bacterium]